jgi:hypothetical protein
MLKIEDMMPQSPIHAKVLEWKKMTTQYGGGEVLDGVVIADQTEPNHWIYLDPNKPTAPDEWLVVFHTPSDDSTYPDLVAYFESRIDEIRTIQHLMSDGELPG